MTSPEISVAIIGGIAILLSNLVTAAGSYLIFSRKYPDERIGVIAEARSDNAAAEQALANAGGTWLENYNKLFTLLASRDIQILELKTELHRRDAEIELLKRQVKELTEKVSLLSA